MTPSEVPCGEVEPFLVLAVLVAETGWCETMPWLLARSAGNRQGRQAAEGVALGRGEGGENSLGSGV